MAQRQREGLPRGARVAGYYRVSSFDITNANAVAPELYQREIEAECERYGYELVKVYADVDVSGRAESRSKLVQLDKLLSERHLYAAVITPMLSRFGRSVKHLSDTFQKFDDDGIAINFLDVRVDTSTSVGRLVRNIFASLAEFESDRISESWIRVLDNRASKGQPVGGRTTPYGYVHDVAGDTYQRDSVTAPVVVEIFRRYAAGDSAYAIAEDLTRRNVPFVRRSTNGVLKETNVNGRWNGATIGAMVENVAYVGKLRRGDKPVTEGNWLGIVKPELFEAAAQRREVVGKAYKRGVKRVEGQYLLSGILQCGVCGSNLHFQMGTKDGRTPNRYTCKRREADGRQCSGGAITQNGVEKIVTGGALERLGDAKALKRMLGADGKPKKGVADYAGRLAKLDASKDKALRAFVLDTISEAQYVAMVNEIDSERAEVEAAAAEAEAEGSPTRNLTAVVALLHEHCPTLFTEGVWSDEFGAEWYGLDIATRRRVLRGMVESATTVAGTRPKQVRVTWKGAAQNVS